MKTKFIAHHRSIDDEYQSVKEHCTNVADFCYGFGKNFGLQNTCKLIGYMHDMGKYTDEFQNYIRKSIEYEAHPGSGPKPTGPDHGRYGAAFIMNNYNNGDKFRRLTAQIESMVICYHHGGLNDFITPDLKNVLYQRTELLDDSYKSALQRFKTELISEKIVDALFEKSVQEIKDTFLSYDKDNRKKFFQTSMLIKLLYSCLVDADRYDTYLFCENAKDNQTDIKDFWIQVKEKLLKNEADFNKKKSAVLSEDKIKKLRNEILQECKSFADEPTGIYTLTVPTGGGKTISSMRFAVEHALSPKHDVKKHIIYVLPFTTIIEQNAEVIRKIVGKGEHILEHHSNVTEENCSYNYKLLSQRWDCPIIFTTMVQFLNTFFDSGTQSIRRFHNLSDSVIIFDEIQALPINCISLFNETVNFLRHFCNSTIVLCSATQPDFSVTKQKIDIENEIIHNAAKKYKQFKRMNIIDKCCDGKMTIDSFAVFTENLMQDNNSILIVMNTKNMARTVFEKLKEEFAGEDAAMYHLSTSMCPAHRKKIISEMKKNLTDTNQKVICVSTQLIEAGVDISFSCVIRHIAGMDSVAQASGRGNRNGKDKMKNTYIVSLENENLSHLHQIELGEIHTAALLDKYRRSPEKFDNELLSPASIKEYYDNYFNDADIKQCMDFPVKKLNKSIFDMLTNDPVLKTDYKNKNGNEKVPMLTFQFKSAADSFYVIEKGQTSVIVPYDEGEKLITQLIGNSSLKEKKDALKSIQQYVVNVSSSVMKRLEDQSAVVRYPSIGISVLKEQFYDNELGIVTDAQKMDFTSF